MELKSLSASSAQLYEDCPSRWNAEYHGRADQIGSAPAKKGTVVHATLESWVRAGWHLAPPSRPEAALIEIYNRHYEHYFSDTAEYDDGLEMVLHWFRRTDWAGRTVLDLEVKKSFPIVDETTMLTIPFNYIFDRVDRLDAEEPTIEVTDYKTWRNPINAEALRHKLQAKAYALAASLEYPDAEHVWVVMDQLRYEPVGVKFKKAELEEFHAYLERLVDRILADEDPQEILNKDCQYCVRKLSCKALATNTDAGGTLGNLTDLGAAGLLRTRVANRMKGLESLLGEIDGFIVNEMQHRDVVEIDLPANDHLDVHIELNLSKRREISAERAAKVVGPEIIARYGKLNVGAVDALLKKDCIEITEEQKQDLAKLVTVKWGSEPTPTVKVKDLS